MLINQEDTSVTPKDYCGNCDIAVRYDATQIHVNIVCNNDVAQWKEHCMLRIEKCTDRYTRVAVRLRPQVLAARK